MTEKEKEYARTHAKELKKAGRVFNEKTGRIEIVEKGYIKHETKKPASKKTKK